MTPSVCVVVACVNCAETAARARRAEVERDRALKLAADSQTRADAERRHAMDLEERLTRHAPKWSKA